VRQTLNNTSTESNEKKEEPGQTELKSNARHPRGTGSGGGEVVVRKRGKQNTEFSWEPVGVDSTSNCSGVKYERFNGVAGEGIQAKESQGKRAGSSWEWRPAGKMDKNKNIHPGERIPQGLV